MREGTAAAFLAGHFDPEEIRKWFAGCRIELDDGRAIVRAPKPYIADWIRDRFTPRLLSALRVSGLDVVADMPPTVWPHLPAQHAAGRG